jgi:hypothetical protein
VPQDRIDHLNQRLKPRRPTLSDIGVTKSEFSWWQAKARLTEPGSSAIVRAPTTCGDVGTNDGTGIGGDRKTNEINGAWGTLPPPVSLRPTLSVTSRVR